MEEIFFLLILTILTPCYSESDHIGIVFLSGKDTKVKTAVVPGEARDGVKYYQVESNDDQINGCYKKINFHNLHTKHQGRKYPIYKQTGGHKETTFYLRIDVDKEFAPWMFSTENSIKYT